MAKKKEEKEEKVGVTLKEAPKEEAPKKEKKVAKKKQPQEEKESIIKLVAELKLDVGLVAGALNNKGLYLQFIEGLKEPSKELKMTKKEFKEIIDEFRYGEL